ncbi:MAG: hypothetical protein ABW044_03525 [Cellvibrio sp.]
MKIMKPTYYFILAFILVAFGIVFMNHNSSQTPSSITSTENTNVVSETSVENKDKHQKDIYENRTKEIVKSIVVTEANTLPKVDLKKAMPFAENTEATEPEPGSDNSSVAASGDYADEVNSPNKNNECDAACETAKLEPTEIADTAKANIPATGEFADQINADAIFAQAQQKDPSLQMEAKLADVPANSLPPTELGVYTPPPQ